MQGKFIFQKTYELSYEVKEVDGVEMITVSVPKIGKKTAQLGSTSAENLAHILANDIFNEFEGK